MEEGSIGIETCSETSLKGEELLRSWSPDQVHKFLLNNNVNENAANKLLVEQLDGNMLIELDHEDLKDVVGILHARFVKKKVEELIDDKVSIPASSVQKKKAEKQVLRKFQQAFEGYYIQGNYIPHEIGAGTLLEPSREFKQFDGNIDQD